MTKQTKTLTTYKGFDEDLKCRGFQYEFEKIYEHQGNVTKCRSGFHACEYPLDTFSYYSPSTSRYAIVEQSGDIDKETNGDTKVSSKVIKIKAEIDFQKLTKATIDFTLSRVKKGGKGAHKRSDKSLASNTGD